MKFASPLVTLIAGILLFFIPLDSIKMVLAIYLIVIGILGLVKDRKWG